MDVFFDDRQNLHHPKTFLVKGQIAASPEIPDRSERLLEGARAAGGVVRPPEDKGLAPIEAVHEARYLAFLRTIHARWRELPGAGDEVIPNVHPRTRDDAYPTGAVGQAGFHQADTACPIGAHTWDSAYWSAQTALSATDAVAAGAPVAYALSRPPGHHAFADQAGGFCFLNNSAIAAQRLRDHGARPAILDVDVHHGNGTQGIFFHRGDVLTVSIHGDPSGFYPFFWGYADERGVGEGEGCNLNLPLALGSGDDLWLDTLELALDAVRAFGADALVVALGLDAHEGDPFQALRVTTPGFTRIAERIASLGLPTVLVQEGGYPSPALGDNIAAFLRGF